MSAYSSDTPTLSIPIGVTLQNLDVFESFYPAIMEQRLTPIGRIFSPIPTFCFTGLDVISDYQLSLRFEKICEGKYQYSTIKNRWVIDYGSSLNRVPSDKNIFMMQNIQTGAALMRKEIDFKDPQVASIKSSLNGYAKKTMLLTLQNHRLPTPPILTPTPTQGFNHRRTASSDSNSPICVPPAPTPSSCNSSPVGNCCQVRSTSSGSNTYFAGREHQFNLPHPAGSFNNFCPGIHHPPPGYHFNPPVYSHPPPICKPSKSLNVLVYSPVFGGSHSKFMGNIADALTEAGHNVTFLVPVADVTRRHEIGVKLTKNVIIVDKPNQDETNIQSIDMDEVLRPLWTIQNRPVDFETCFVFFLEMMKSNCDDFTSNKKVFEELSRTKFDVAIAEPVSICGLGYFDALGINKTILASSTTHYEGVVRNSGEPVDMSYVPVHGAYFDEKMDIFQRYTNWAAAHVMAENLEVLFDEEMERYRKNLGANIGHWRDLIPLASVFFTNRISIWIFHVQSFKKLLESEGFQNSILDTIKQFPNVTFVWKYESDDLKWAEGVENVHFLKWIPQSALLNDDRVTAFLTHGGLGSTNELAYLGKPAIVVPIFGDQGRNAPMLARHGGALVLQKFDLDRKEILVNSVQKIMFDKRWLCSKSEATLATSEFNSILSKRIGGEAHGIRRAIRTTHSNGSVYSSFELVPEDICRHLSFHDLILFTCSVCTIICSQKTL
ncbi:Protein CBG03975 [Caenorhabditis briggsae]|uniref:glucuronosyltransferase n=1 Tax=Caenorhabditis briggsae TaxID=6238 RepID=A8WVW1_CAEBR|nr:Protein CBG03975 [Caenorhabditis briggsae]CAP24774.2 Protein CBG03975 [Caenorhabditis briggsae]